LSDEGPQTPNLRAATVEGLRWTAIARPIIEVVLLGSMVVLARLIPPAEFGRFAVAAIVGELAMLIPSEGIGAALVQRQTVTRAHLQAGFSMALVWSAVLTLLTLLAASTIITPLFDARTSDIVRLAAPGILIAAFATVPMALLRRRLDFRRLSIIDFASTTVRAGASVALALAGLGAEALVLGGLLAGVVAIVIAWTAAPAPPPRPDREARRDLLGYGLPASLAAASWVGFRNCDYAIVGARLGTLEAGYYFRAYMLAVEYQKKISLVMGQVGFPVLARASSPEERSELQSRMVRLLTTLLFPLLCLLAILAPTAIPWIFGPAWEAAVVPTQILALGGASTLVIDAAGAALMAAGRSRALLGYGVSHFAVYAAVVFAATPFGLAGVAVGASLVHTAFLVVAYALMLRGTAERALPRLWHDLKPAMVSCLGLAAVAVPLALMLASAGTPAILQIVAVGIAGSVAYAVTLRTCFAALWRSLMSVFGQVLPERSRRAFTRRLAPWRARLAPTHE
jgi:O-antigen/teichoic acid export membrane protein